MTIDAVIAALNRINDRTELVAFLAPLRLRANLDDFERGALSAALMRAATRCWKRRFPA
jgi:hypothetical protein